MDIPTIAAVLSSLKSASDIAKLLRETDLSLEKAEVKLKLADLISSLADAKMQIAEVQDSLREKDAIIRDLQESLSIKSNLIYEGPYYWQIQGDKKDGPFCQQCYDAESKLIRLQKRKTIGKWECMKCEKVFQDKNYREPPHSPIRGRVV